MNKKKKKFNNFQIHKKKKTKLHVHTVRNNYDWMKLKLINQSVNNRKLLVNIAKKDFQKI